MAETIREKILQELATRAGVMRLTSPAVYATDIGAAVYRARPKIGPEELPCTVVWPRSEEVTYAFGRVLHTMPVDVEGLVELGTADPSVLGEAIYGDLVRCFTDPAWDRRRPVAGSPITYLAPYAESMVLAGGGSDAPEDGALTCGAQARLVVTYWTVAGDPTAQ